MPVDDRLRFPGGFPPAPAPDISVLIAAWRAEAWLARATASALAQTGIEVEVVVVDDASPDATYVAARRLADADPRIRVARLAENGGPSVARNHALGLARGRFVAVLDADDAMRPDRLARMLRLAEASSAEVVLGNLAICDAEGREEGPFLPPLVLPASLTAEGFVAGNLRAAGGRSLGYLKPLIRRDFLTRAGLCYDPTLRNGEDYHLILACLLAGARLRVDPVPGYLYTRAAGSVSHRFALDQLSALIAAEDRLLARLCSEGAAPPLLALLRQRRRGLADLLTTETTLRATRAGRLGLAVRTLLSRPRALPMLARQAGEGLWRRMAPRRGGA